jgi:RecA/RadA recombinase
MKRTRASSLSEQIKKKVSIPLKKQAVGHINPNDLVPMGSTLLNLAMSGSIEGGAKKGTMVNIIGSSHGGKTMLALTSFAETNRKESFKDYSFIYDDVECANSFNMPYLFGKQTARRIKSARPEKEEPFSSTVQHFQANVSHYLKKDNPFLYVLDSFDALDAKEDQKKMEEMVDALEKDKKDVAGTYGMAKAKASSSILRNIISGLSKSKSVLFIVSQTRDNIDPRSFSKETRSGGRALKFYAHHEMWLKSTGELKRKIRLLGLKLRLISLKIKSWEHIEK